jgi:hypothetical protein
VFGSLKILAGTMHIIRALALALMPFAACWQLILLSQGSTPSGMLASATVVLAGLALAFLAHGRIATAVTTRPLAGRASALREKSRGAVFQRQLNPDAEGHPRPRAPGAVPAAA